MDVCAASTGGYADWQGVSSCYLRFVFFVHVTVFVLRHLSHTCTHTYIHEAVREQCQCDSIDHEAKTPHRRGTVNLRLVLRMERRARKNKGAEPPTRRASSKPAAMAMIWSMAASNIKEVAWESKSSSHAATSGGQTSAASWRFKWPNDPASKKKSESP